MKRTFRNKNWSKGRKYTKDILFDRVFAILIMSSETINAVKSIY